MTTTSQTIDLTDDLEALLTQGGDFTAALDAAITNATGDTARYLLLAWRCLLVGGTAEVARLAGGPVTDETRAGHDILTGLLDEHTPTWRTAA